MITKNKTGQLPRQARLVSCWLYAPGYGNFASTLHRPLPSFSMHCRKL